MTAVFVQARLASKRLPRKALLPLAGKPAVEHALRALGLLEAGVHALLTDEESFGELEPIARRCGFRTFPGPADDVLERFALAAEEFRPDRIVRATADNPLVSIELASRLLDLHGRAGADYSAHVGPPIGTGVEVVETRALLSARRRAVDPYEREHVCPFLYRRESEFAIHRPSAPEALRMPEAAVTLDTEEDYRFLAALFDELYRGEPIGIRALVSWLRVRSGAMRPEAAEGHHPGTQDPVHPFRPRG